VSCGAGRAKGGALEMCKALLEEFRVEGSMYQMGKTRLFFRAGVLGHLEDTWARIQRSNSHHSHLTCLCAMHDALGVQHFPSVVAPRELMYREDQTAPPGCDSAVRHQQNIQFLL